MFSIIPYHCQIHHAGIEAALREYGWESLPVSVLPPDGFVAVDHDGTILAWAFVYLSPWSPGMSLLAFPGARKGIPPHQILPAVLSRCADLARERIGPAGVMLAFTANPFVGRCLRKHGFHVGEKETTSYFLPIGSINTDFLEEDSP